MSAPATTNELISLIHKSGIADPASLSDRLRELDALPPSPTQSAALLVQRGVLTKFQAKLLLTGRFRGFKLGPYVVQEHLGQGGMGAVYLAEHEQLKRRVAVKVLTQPKGDQQGKLALERFLREARAAAALDHPNIVRVHDVSKQGDVHFLVLEYVEGQTLEQLTSAAGAVPPGRAVSLIAQAAAGLQHAFEKGFVHRDIKPANLMLTKDGTVKVLDMGLARSLSGEGDKLTERMDEGAIVGTADFISPEQAMNLPNIDIRSDIYSLGATFFALVTGKPPFAGNTTQKLVQHQMKDPPSLDSIDRTVPPELALVVSKMLHKKPEKRYQTPAEVITALAPWLTEAGATKIVAGLSGTDLAGSVEMQNTLNEIVQGGTKRISQSKRLAATKKTPVGVYAAAAAAVLAAGGLVAFMTLGGKPADAGVAGVSPGGYVPPQPQPQPQPKPSNTPPRTLPVAATVPAPRRAPALWRMELDKLPDFRFTLRDSTAVSGAQPPLPAGWSLNSWKPNALGEFAKETVAGRPAVGLAARDGDPSAQLTIDLEPAVTLAPGKEYLVRFDYLTTGEATGSVIVHDPRNEYKILGKSDTGPTNGQWRTAEVRFTRPADGVARFAFQTFSTAASGMAYLASAELIDAAAPAGSRANVLFALDPAAVAPFRVTKQGSITVSGGPEGLPPGVAATCWKNETQAVFTSESVDGVPAIGITNLDGPNSAELAFEAERPDGRSMGLELVPGREYLLRVEYKTARKADGQMYFQRLKKNTAGQKDICKEPLPNTGGEWRAAELKLVRADERVRFVVSNLAVGDGHTLYVRRVELLDLSAPPARAAAPAPPAAFHIDFDALQPDTLEVRGRVQFGNRLGAQTLPAGLHLNHYDPASDADYLLAEMAGARALGLRSVNGKRAQVLAKPADLFRRVGPGQSGTFVIQYQYDGPGAGRTGVQLNKKPHTMTSEVPLTPTAGEWRTVDLPFTRTNAEEHVLVLDVHAPGGTLWVRAIDGYAAASPAPVYRLDLSAQRPFVARGNSQATGDPAEDVRFVQLSKTGDGDWPAGWRGTQWDGDSEAEFLAAEKAGRMAVGMKSVRLGTTQPKAFSGMIFSPRGPVPGKVRVRFTYLTDAPADWENMAQVKFKPTNPVARAWPIPAVERLNGTGGKWVDKECDVDLAGATEGFFEFHCFDADPARGFYLSAFELTDPAAAAPAAVAPPAGPPAVYRLTAAEVAPFRCKKTGFNVTEGTADKMPANVYFAAHHRETVAEYSREDVDGQPALGWSLLSGEKTAQIGIELEKPDGTGAAKMTAGRKYTVRIVYKTTGGGRGDSYTQTHGDYKGVDKAWADMPDTGGRWQTVEYAWVKPDKPVRLLVDNKSAQPGAVLYVREVTVTDADAAPPARAAAAPPAPAARAMADGATLYNLDMPAKAFKYTLLDGKADPANAAEFFPAGVYAHCWKPESVAEVRGEPTDAGLAVGVTNLNDTLSSQLKFDFEGGIALKLKPNTEYKVRVEYRTAGDAAGVANARTPGDGYKAIGRAELPGTGGNWRTAEFVFRRAAHGVDVTVENLTVGEGNTLFVRKLELIERVPATAASARPASQSATPPSAPAAATVVLDPGSLPAFAATFSQNKQTGGTAPRLPAGFGLQAYDKATVAKAWTETIGGRPAVGLVNESGKPSVQLYFDTHAQGRPPAVQAGRRYVLRLDYLTRADATANVQVQVYGKWDQKPAFLRLEPTRGQWQTTEVPFESGSEPLRVNVNNTAPGGGNPLYVARFELVPAD